MYEIVIVIKCSSLHQTYNYITNNTTKRLFVCVAGWTLHRNYQLAAPSMHLRPSGSVRNQHQVCSLLYTTMEANFRERARGEGGGHTAAHLRETFNDLTVFINTGANPGKDNQMKACAILNKFQEEKPCSMSMLMYTSMLCTAYGTFLHLNAY